MSKKHTAITQSQSHFANAVHANVQRSVFMRNSTRKTTFNAGSLIPIYCDEVLPGDTFEMDMTFVSRLSTPIFPTMDNLHLDFYAFFVPNRIVWDGWEELNGENKTSAWVPTTPPALVPQTKNTTTIASGTLGDHYGLPVGRTTAQMGGVSVLPIRGYLEIYNEWFRDQNLQAPGPVGKGNTISPWDLAGWTIPPMPVNKKRDYFTSCLPAPQKGESALIPIELNELIPVITGINTPFVSGHGGLRVRAATAGASIAPDTLMGTVSSLYQTSQGIPAGTLTTRGGNGGTVDHGTQIQPANLWADGRGLPINSTTISELRTAFQIQKLYERDARGGTRYVEMLKAHFGVDAQDYRLQRPEFLGHMHTHVGIQQVPQTSSTDSTSPQGNMAAFSYTSGQQMLFKKSFVEHGFVHIFAVARHPKTYQQGLEKFWSRKERLDFYMPVLAHISEQPVLNKEIYVGTNVTENEEVFGYNEAWADYRYKPNSVAGQFRSNAPNTLDNWHYADWYTAKPTLSGEWMIDNSKTNVDRTIAVTSAVHDQIIMDIAFKCKCTRPMPVHSIPGLVDHF